MKYICIFFVLSICILTGCKSSKVSNSQTGQESTSKKDSLDNKAVTKLYPEFNSQILKDSLQQSISNKSLASGAYKSNGYSPLWIKDIDNIGNIDTLLCYLQHASEHGLNAESFGKTKIQNIADSIKQGAFSDKMPLLYQAAIRLDILATNAAIDYVTGLKFGFVDPQKLFPGGYFIPTQKPDTSHYNSLFSGLKTNPAEVLASAQPKDNTYSQMQTAFKFYKENEKATFTPIPVKKGNANYKLNEKSASFPLIAKRLMLSGELPVSEHADSLYEQLNTELLDAVNAFRRKNSFPEEKEIGKITVDALNRPMEYYSKKMQANLERYRWRRVTQLSDKYIEVNVAAFMLKAIEPSENPLLMNVCVGSVKNQTPLLEGKISYMNLNPTWNVPRSIIEKEIYHSIKNDSAYLAKNRMKLVKNGEEVDPKTVTWDSIHPKRFPYMVIQDTGDGNSLGRVKFMFSNPFSVYLHDTPSKRAFTAKNRAVSHGCVRVQKPVDLIYFCLSEKDSLYFDRIRYSIDQPALSVEGKRLRNAGKLQKVGNIINLKSTVPLFIDYFTVYMLPEDNELYFADDIYGFDEKIIKALGGRL